MRRTLNGYVVSDSDAWFYRYFNYAVCCPQDIRTALEELPAGEALIFEVNSPGGSVWAGGEMYSLLRGAAADTTAEVQSIAASAMSYVIAGCKQVLLSPVAQIMMHPPAVETRGDAAEHGRSMNLLGSTTEAILNAYELKCKGKTDRATLRTKMENTCWLDAKSAIELGLADGMLYAEELEAANGGVQEVFNAAGGGIRSLANSGGLPPVAQLQARYEAEQEKKEEPPQGENTQPQNSDLSAERLALEKIRFI